jgi:hypothetical protein
MGVILGAIADFGALAFAPQSTLTPIGGGRLISDTTIGLCVTSVGIHSRCRERSGDEHIFRTHLPWRADD